MESHLVSNLWKSKSFILLVWSVVVQLSQLVHIVLCIFLTTDSHFWKMQYRPTVWKYLNVAFCIRSGSFLPKTKISSSLALKLYCQVHLFCAYGPIYIVLGKATLMLKLSAYLIGVHSISLPPGDIHIQLSHHEYLWKWRL